MDVLRGKHILLGVTGGIAAYKSTFLVRLFIKAGAEVKVMLTPSAKDFVSPLTLSTLSKNEVISSFTKEEEKIMWNDHVHLALWADSIIIAPATANTLSKMAAGNSDNFLLATYLSAKCAVYVAPAMDLDMYRHPSTIKSLETLRSFGNFIIEPETGELASGLVGEGRMAEPENILKFMEQHIFLQLPLKGKKIMITAGPTYESIDPVRFIGNHSSGKMGYALAEVAANLGASVILVSGPTNLKLNHVQVKTISVTTAAEMFQETLRHYDEMDAVIAAAAVADYKPKHVSNQKIKKEGDTLFIECERTQDILQHLGQIKKRQLLIGFALETENEIENAKKKLKKKNLDFIVLNSLNDKGAGFKSETNKITLIKPSGITKYETKTKNEVAKDIIDELIKMLP